VLRRWTTVSGSSGGLPGLKLNVCDQPESSSWGKNPGNDVPRSSGSGISPGEKFTSGDCWRVLAFELDERGGVGRLERGT
jgi:hypothetical protein